ncbi:spore maturation protein B [Tissierella praeacuta DSM 18095]|uniref:Spore maturation protein B n=1 Tax=Tissierella praeacuta DSM 18095 TaxID=1123404 RepID=A0A1M4TQE1_9FIRM|nr:spore maturation protein [Tissierella praeacuta]SHE46604.1 spore maturation protein B [Tissierella praeacuta DSM 18095]SUP04416.1 Spore maturation protein B [Tissierella praeacuta]
MFIKVIEAISNYAIPLIIVGFLVFGMSKKVKVYESFTEGAKEGFTTAVRIIPFLVAMLVAIGVFRASGAMGLLTKALSPITNLIGMPGEILPMAFMRPLSGGGAEGIMTDLITTHGPESLIGRMAAVMMGSTETTFYVLSVYFGSVSVKKQRHALPVGLLADLAGLITAVLVTRLFFGM